MKIERFEQSIAWQKARALNKVLYEFTLRAPCSSDWDFCRQLRRASLSIMNNIAEGFERHSLREQQHFLTISKGSAGEVRSMVYVGLDVGHFNQDEFGRLKSQVEE
ncbi:MAG: four helix bundle protein [Dehalococcoidia bacterium]